MGETHSLLHGRFRCETCRVTAAVVRDSDVEEVRCPKCGNIAVPACGDED